MEPSATTILTHQTSILCNYALSKLIAFFLSEKSSIFLYDTICITRKETKKEMAAIGKTAPTTKKYSVYCERLDDKLNFVLRAEGYSDIRFYSTLLLSTKPTIRCLKAIAKEIVITCRPIPTTIDKNFSELAQKYYLFLAYHQLKRSWQNGYFPKYPLHHRHGIEEKVAHADYTDFLNDISRLSDNYKVFCKILLDIYKQNSAKKYLSADKTYILTVDYNNEFGVNLVLESLTENHSYNEIIKAEEFTPTAFSDNQIFVKGMYKAVLHTFSKS